MFGTYFYHEHTRKAVAVFGTLFNNISVRKVTADGKVLSNVKVPLSYGPRQKFLVRMEGEENLDDPGLAIKLPRMAFEITSIKYDTNTKLQKGIKRVMESNPDSSLRKRTILYPVTYKVTFQLSILAKAVDEALQIMEQIIPFFQPDYAVTVKELDNNFKSDMSFSLGAISMTDDYGTGDFKVRRSIIYTLDFESRIRYHGPITDTAVIKQTTTTLSDFSARDPLYEPFSVHTLKVIPRDAEEDDDYAIESVFDPKVAPKVKLYVNSSVGDPIEVNELVEGQDSGAVGRVAEVNTEEGYLLISAPDSNFIIDERVSSVINSSNNVIVINIQNQWNILPQG